MKHERYPDNWETIARTIRDAAGWCCEACRHPHDPASGYTLTVHHLDLNPVNNNRCNLVALCQRCHLRVQARYRPGQQWLPFVDAPGWARRRELA